MPSDESAQRAVEAVSATQPHFNETWEAACLNAPPMKCGRLDMHTYDALTGECQRYVYVDGSERTLVQGAYCDEIAYMAQRFKPLKQEIAALAAENARMKEHVARLTRWMQPKVTLSIGLDYHDCEIVDVGHSEIQLMVRCPDLEAENARLTAALADAKAEGERAEKKVAVMREILERVQWCMPLSIQSPLYCPTCEHRTDLGHAPDCAIHIAIKNSAREAHLAALASGGQAGKADRN